MTIIDLRNKRVLVTGAAGFIGSHLVEALLARGDRVVGLDNFDPYYDPAIKRRNVLEALLHENYQLVEGDIRDCAVVDAILSGARFDAIVHLAARAGVRPSIAEPELYHKVNVSGTVNLLEAARRHEVPHFVFGSSSSVYGATSQAPFREDDRADRPSSPYAATKRASELDCYSYHHLYGITVACLRFFTVYGPRQRPEMAIHKFTRQIAAGEMIDIYGDGKSTRDYTYVSDIVGGIIATVDRPVGYEIYNLGATGLTALGHLVAMIAERLNRPLLLRHLPDQPGDVPLTHADIAHATKLLTYRATTPIDLGLTKFVAWYLENEARNTEAVTALPISA